MTTENAPTLSIDKVVPGGIKNTDYLHIGKNDNTCSRCRKSVEDEVPLLLWLNDGEDMLIYCGACMGWPPQEDDYYEDDYGPIETKGSSDA